MGSNVKRRANQLKQRPKQATGKVLKNYVGVDVDNLIDLMIEQKKDSKSRLTDTHQISDFFLLSKRKTENFCWDPTKGKSRDSAVRMYAGTYILTYSIHSGVWCVVCVRASKVCRYVVQTGIAHRRVIP